MRAQNSPRCARPVLVALAAAVLTGTAAAQDIEIVLDPPPGPVLEPGQPVLLVEPLFMRHKAAREIPGARQSQLVPGVTTADGIDVLGPDAFAARGQSWSAFVKAANATAAAHLKTVKIEWFRDANGLAEFARIRNPSPLTASVVHAPEFLDRFKASLGDRLLVGIPDRNTVYVFPRTMPTIFKRLSPEIAEAYARALYPVSPEAFELTPNRFAVVGSFLDD